jgi:protease IV
MHSDKKVEKSVWSKMIWIVLMLMLFSFMVSVFIGVFSEDVIKDGNVAIIYIEGVILPNGNSYLGQEVSSTKEILEFLDDAKDDPRTEAVVLAINSPGGSAVASYEIAEAVKQLNKTTVAWIRDMGTSGAYWVASAADVIIANPMSITGSIGVTASYLQFSGLLKDYNITYEQLKAGDLKEIGNPLVPLKSRERRLFQAQLDELHDYFISSVAKNRDLSVKEVKPLSTGMFFLGSNAVKNGLVDILGGKGEAKAYLEEELNTTVEFFAYESTLTLLDVLSKVASKQSFSLGQGIGSSILNGRVQPNVQVWT